jgi:hypothetical protein
MRSFGTLLALLLIAAIAVAALHDVIMIVGTRLMPWFQWMFP